MVAQPLSIMLLAKSEKAAALDRRALRDAGFSSVRVQNSGIEAAKLLAGLTTSPDNYLPDIVICQSQLEDMEGEQFCAIIREHPQLLGFPILLILPNDQEAQQLLALGCGASALIGRPYSIDTLKNQLGALVRSVPGERKLREASGKVDLKAFDEALATYGVLLKTERQPEDFFRAAMKCLNENRWGTAIVAFERALRDGQIKAEAELGIAAAYKGKGDIQRSQAWLARSTETFVAAKRWNRARSAYAKLLQIDPSARNPFLAEAHRLIRQGDYEEAAEVLVHSLGVISGRKAGERYARVCMAAEEPEKMYQALSERLTSQKGEQYAYLASDIRQSLDVMERQKEERQRILACERKWELGRAMKQAEAKRGAANSELTPGTGKTGESAKPIRFSPASRKPEIRSEPAVAELDKDELEGLEDDQKAMLLPFRPEGKKQGFNELLSVIKLTWKLSRRAEKSGK